MAKPRVAIVHDWLITAGGAERVLARICALLPTADLFCLIGERGLAPQPVAHNAFVQSWLGRLPGVQQNYRWLAPLMPFAAESLPLKGYDLVVSSTWAFAHGVRPSPQAIHLAYVHSPMRWAWDMQAEYLDRWSRVGIPKGLAQLPLSLLRRWDARAGQRPTALLANSQFIQQRIARCWARPSRLLYPPVAADPPQDAPYHDAYVAVSRLVPYKRVDIIVKAFAALPERRLIVAGDGPEMSRLRAMAGPNVSFAGWVTDAQALQLMAGSRGFIQASKEDFGIAVVEAQACGVPVLAYADGGAAETVVTEGERPTGRLFKEDTAESLVAALRDFESRSFRAADCKSQAQRFSVQAFDQGFYDALAEHGFEPSAFALGNKD